MEVLDLIEEGQEVTPPDGLVYSQHPRRSLAQNEQTYFVKGPDINVVVPEVICHLLAPYVGLQVPEFALARRTSVAGLFFASREIVGFRSVESFLKQGRVQNPDLVKLMHLFDVMVANQDRNLGNLVGESSKNPRNANVRLVAIDFEKAEAFRGNYPLTTVPTIIPSRLRPSGILGGILQDDKTMGPHFEAIEKIEAGHVATAFATLEAAIGHQIDWKESSVPLVAQRARNIRNLFAEVWR